MMEAETRSAEICIETKGLLFDMDGVLVRSIGSVVRCWQEWCVKYGVPDAENFQVPHGTRDIGDATATGGTIGGGGTARSSAADLG
jgi:sugar-phosphatase